MEQVGRGATARPYSADEGNKGSFAASAMAEAPRRIGRLIVTACGCESLQNRRPIRVGKILPLTEQERAPPRASGHDLSSPNKRHLRRQERCEQHVRFERQVRHLQYRLGRELRIELGYVLESWARSSVGQAELALDIADVDLPAGYVELTPI